MLKMSSILIIKITIIIQSHIGKLTGLGSIAGAIFSLIMVPLMSLVQGPLNGNPFKVCTFINILVAVSKFVHSSVYTLTIPVMLYY